MNNYITTIEVWLRIINQLVTKTLDCAEIISIFEATRYSNK